MPNDTFDLAGRKIGKWTVLRFSRKSKYGHIIWQCVCDCGTSRELRTDVLVRGVSTSCGCAKREALMNRMIGHSFSRLTVASLHHIDKKKQYWWLCRCQCGKECVARTDHLEGGRVVSCGCHAREKVISRNFRHGLKHTTEYKIWEAIIRRCCNPNNPRYPAYGGRGITICPEWRNDFTAFLAAMGPRPSPKHTIDRINNDKGYEPGNCRWATHKEQSNNKRTNVRLDVDGECLTISQWSDRLGIPYSRIHSRYERNKEAAIDFIRQVKSSMTPNQCAA